MAGPALEQERGEQAEPRRGSWQHLRARPLPGKRAVAGAGKNESLHWIRRGPVIARLGELVERVGRLERETAGLRMAIANLHEDFAGLSGRLDRYGERMGWIDHERGPRRGERRPSTEARELDYSAALYSSDATSPIKTILSMAL